MFCCILRFAMNYKICLLAEGVNVLHRMERAAVESVNSPLKFDRRDRLVASTNVSESRSKLNRDKVLVVPLAVNMSLAQAVHG